LPRLVEISRISARGYVLQINSSYFYDRNN